MEIQKRWVILKHIEKLNDINAFHFDLLLEDDHDCLTWRLNNIPILDGPVLDLFPLPRHKRYWLETSGRIISGSRGWAGPFKKGFFRGVLPLDRLSPISVELFKGDLKGELGIFENKCRLRSISVEKFQ